MSPFAIQILQVVLKEMPRHCFFRSIRQTQATWRTEFAQRSGLVCVRFGACCRLFVLFVMALTLTSSSGMTVRSCYAASIALRSTIP